MKQKRIFTYRDFHYYRCVNCQLVSTYPLPSKETIEKHYENRFTEGNYSLLRSYSEQYKAVYGDFVTILKERLGKRHDTLNGKKVLDIGCFTGEFLELLQDESADVYGLELQDDAVRIANQILPGRIFQADVMTDAIPQKKYDIITLLGVVEHVTDPMRLLKRSSRLLRRGGILLVQTPNSSSLLAQIMGKFWPPYSPVEHIHLFSRKSLENALEACGLRDISSAMHWKKLPIGYVYNQFRSFGPEFYTLLKPLDPLLNKSRLVLPFYVGEMMMIASKE